MNDLIKHYRELASEIGNLSYEGKDTESLYRRLLAVLKEIVREGQELLLFRLFSDPDIWVQLLAATHCLEVNEQDAVKKLECLAIRPGLSGMTAKYTLREWRANGLGILAGIRKEIGQDTNDSTAR